MWIVSLASNDNGSHNDHRSDNIARVPDGYAMIPDGFKVPETFPFVDIQAEEVTYYNEVERTRKVKKTREVLHSDEEGEPASVMEEYEEEEVYTEQVPCQMMTVAAMSPRMVPEPAPEPELPPATEERVTALEEALVQADKVVIELYETQAAQDEALIELYERMEG